MKKLGLGCMRFPLIGDSDEIDLEKVSEMVDVFMKEGFNYFDTAHGYHGGRSEEAMRNVL